VAAQSGRSRFEAPFVWPAHEILSRYATSTTIQLFLRPLENNYPVIPTSPLCGLRFQVVHRQTSFRVRGGSRSEVSAMGDRRKCQTYAASPAEPGGLPVMLVRSRLDRALMCGWQTTAPFPSLRPKVIPGSVVSECCKGTVWVSFKMLREAADEFKDKTTAPNQLPCAYSAVSLPTASARLGAVSTHPVLAAASHAKPHSTANCEPRCVHCNR
jgi:hypothetical protein